MPVADRFPRVGWVLVALVCVLVAGLQAAKPQAGYPVRPIALIVPFPPGGSTDVIARVVADGLRVELGQPVIVENRAGAGGSTGTAAIAKAPPDGYTIGMGTASTLAINPAVYSSLSYDVLTDLAAVSNIAAVPNIMSVHPSIKATNLAEFVAFARTQRGKLAYASAGNGSVSHLMGEQFKLATGIDLLHVPYRGVGPALNDAVAGQVQVMFDNLPTTLPMVESGRLRGLAVSGPVRAAALPQVATFGQQGFEALNWMAFFGIVAPARTPEAIVMRLHEAIVRVLAVEAVRKRLDGQGAMLIVNAPEAFSADIQRAFTRMRAVVEAAGIVVN